MLRRGDYALCNFPFREYRGPGPSPHIVLCAATGRQGDTRFAIVFYTTSQTDYAGTRRPRQYLFVSQKRAIELGQKVAFQVDVSRIARLPLTADTRADTKRAEIGSYQPKPGKAGLDEGPNAR